LRAILLKVTVVAMHRPSRWWLGLPALAVLLLAALWMRLSQVQTDVARNASAALSAQGALDPAVSVAGRDVRIAGQALDEPGRVSARAAVEAATGVRLVDGDLAALPVQKPYTLTFARGADGAVATGYAPSPALRATTMKAAGEALGAAVKLRDDRAYAAGAPASYEAAARAALAALAPLKSGAASVSDSALSIVGEAADAGAYAKAFEAAKALPQGLTLARFDVALPKVSPYVFSARRDGADVTLSGSAPDGATKMRLADAAKALGGALVDQTGLGGGAPAGFEAMAKAALAALAPLKNGVATLTDGALAVTGEAADAAAFSKAQEAIKALPQGMTLSRFDVAPPKVSPYVFSARREGPAVTLSGFAPDAATREHLFETARGSAPQALGALGLASGAPAGFEAMAKAALAALAQLKSGVATISDSKLSLSGEAASASARDSLLAMLRAAGLTLDKIDLALPVPPALPAQTSPVAAATPRRPLTEVEAACEGRLLQRLAKEHIEFDTGSSRIASASQALVRELAEVVSSCPTVTLEVQGHTDNVGEEQANLTLSRSRAEAVVKALVAAGAPPDHLSAEGYGESRPIASNDTPEGRAQNRRIEFAVK
jgi:OOP family OmpA-OmpF porin